MVVGSWVPYRSAEGEEERGVGRGGEGRGREGNTWERGGSNPGFTILAKILHFFLNFWGDTDTFDMYRKSCM